jgi:diguanylate cyclase (GGDEF)-like protein
LESQLSIERVAALLAKQKAVRELVAFMTTRVEMDIHPIFEEAIAKTSQALSAPMACLHLSDEENGKLNMLHSLGLNVFHEKALNTLSLDGVTPPARTHQAENPVLFYGDQAPAGLAAMASAPIKGGDRPVGSISVMWPQGQKAPTDEDRFDFMLIMGRLVGLAVDHAGLVSGLVDNLNEMTKVKTEAERYAQELDQTNQQLLQANRRLEELSRTDGLTGLFNHLFIHQRLEEEILRAERQGHPLTVLMADLDHFKRVNDQLGHQVGDEALRFFSQVLLKNLRRVDAVGRYGGEEFLVILVDCDLESGVMVAEKLRKKVQAGSNAPPFDPMGGFTVSLGAAQWVLGQKAKELVSLADKALYEAKREGRNQVRSALQKKAEGEKIMPHKRRANKA